MESNGQMNQQETASCKRAFLIRQRRAANANSETLRLIRRGSGSKTSSRYLQCVIYGMHGIIGLRRGMRILDATIVVIVFCHLAGKFV